MPRASRALAGLLGLAVACVMGPVSEELRPGSARVRIGRIDGAGLESALRSAPVALPDRAEYLVDLFWQAGCLAVEIPPADQRWNPDVVCSLPGRSPGRIVVVAHLDGKADERGVPWLWRGTALLPFLHRALGVEPREHSFEFAAFRKSPRRRADAYLARLGSPRGEGVVAIVEILGLDPTNLVFSPSGAGLGQRFADAGLAVGHPRSALHLLVQPRGPIGRATVPTILIASPVPDGNPPAVSAARGDARASYLSTARLLAVYLAYLDETLGPRAERSGPAAAAR